MYWKPPKNESGPERTPKLWNRQMHGAASRYILKFFLWIENYGFRFITATHAGDFGGHFTFGIQ